MSFWSRVGDLAEALGGSTPAGVAFGLAHAVADDDHVKKVASQIGHSQAAQMGVTGSATARHVAGKSLNALNIPFHNIGRAISTAEQIRTGDLLNGQAWDEAWNRSKTASPGQVLVNNATEEFSDDQIGGKAWVDRYKHTTSGKIESGAVDLLMNAFDPLNYVDKPIKAVVKARQVVKADDLAHVFGTAEEAATNAASRGGQRKRDVVDKFIDTWWGKTPAEIQATEMARQSADAGALAYAFGTAKDKDAARDVLGAVFGNASSLERLRQANAEQAATLESMLGGIDEVQRADYFSSLEGRDFATAMGWANSPEQLKAITEQADAIEAHLLTMRKVAGDGKDALGLQGVTRLKTGSLAQDRRIAKVSAVINGDSRAGRGVHVVTGNRLPGSFHGADPASVDTFTDVLRAAHYVPAETRNKWLQAFVAAGPKERPAIARNAENDIYLHAAATYAPGMTREELEALARTTRSRKAATVLNMRGRLYAAGDGATHVGLADEDGGLYAVERSLVEEPAVVRDAPVWTGQTSDEVHMVDPALLAKVLKTHGATGMAGYMRRGASGVLELTDAGLTAMNRLWKFSALLRLAYPVRVQVDSQLRLMAHLGVLPYLGMAAKGTKNVVLNDLAHEFPALANPARRLGFDGLVHAATGRSLDAFTDPAQASRVFNFLDGEGTLGQLLSNEGDQNLRHLRTTGDWTRVAGDDPNWVVNYRRILTQQMRHDPLVKAMALGADDDTLVRWLKTNLDGRAHWRLFKHDAIYGGNPELLIQRARGEFERLIPADKTELRNRFLDGDLTDADIKALWPDERARPDIHGERWMAPSRAGGALSWLHEHVAKPWYKFASDAPEATMARHPLYVQRFTAHLRTMLDKHAEDYISDAAYADLRHQADTLARKDIGKILFDLSTQSNLSYMFRFVSPFYSAWEDTMEKWGRLIGTDPSLIQKFNKLARSPNQAGLVHDEDGNVIDADGNVIDAKTGEATGKKAGALDGYIVLPLPKDFQRKTGWDKVKVPKNGLNIIFQGDPPLLPSVGPLAMVPLNALLTGTLPEVFPGASKVNAWGPTHGDNWFAHYVLPYGTDPSNVQQITPAWVKTLLDWRDKSSKGYHDVFTNLYLQNAQENRVKSLGLTDAQLLTKTTRQTRGYFLMNLIGKNASPVSVQAGTRLDFYKQRFNEYQRQYGPDAQEKFMADFPDYYEMGVSFSANETGLQATDESWAATQKLRPEMARNPEYAWALIGAANMAGGFSETVYDAQSAQPIGPGTSKHFRGGKDPVDVLKDVNAEKGWQLYSKMNLLLQNTMEERGISSLNSNAGKPLAEAKAAFIDALSQQNPDWAASRSMNPNKVENFVSYMNRAAAAHPKEIGQRGDYKNLQIYLAARAAVKAKLATRKNKSLEKNPDIQQAWEGFTGQLTERDLGFKQMYDRVLEGDDLTGDL